MDWSVPKRGPKRRKTSKPAEARRKPDDLGALRRDIDAVQDAVLKVQDYLLRTSERIDHILGTLKNHRELLVKMNQRLYQVGTRERIRMELDIMKNTLSILALNGAELDEAIVDEIRKLRESTEKDDFDVVSLRKSKESLDKKFHGEIKKFDPSTIHRSRDKDEPDVPGYG
ncbi:MAG TPA: hypothetical protein VGR51_08390 [Thermoplasmata archaeon]|jgi:hypothetical protein|nr:hypothetical protein [Thermoplasmata archaeon]